MIYFHESELRAAVADVEPRTKIFEIPVDHPVIEENQSSAVVRSTLTAVFEFREHHTETSAIYQVIFIPLIRIPNGDSGEIIPNYPKKFPRRRDNILTDSFYLVVNKTARSVKFGPKDYIIIFQRELRGLGIGSYAFGELIRWARPKMPEFTVDRVKVGAGDARDPVNHLRRNHFYEKHGFRGEFSDPDKTDGFYYIDRVSDLIASDVSPNWVEKDIPETLFKLLDRNLENENGLEKANAAIEVERNRNSALLERMIKYKKRARNLGFVVVLIIVLSFLYFNSVR